MIFLLHLDVRVLFPEYFEIPYLSVSDSCDKKKNIRLSAALNIYSIYVVYIYYIKCDFHIYSNISITEWHVVTGASVSTIMGQLRNRLYTHGYDVWYH